MPAGLPVDQNNFQTTDLSCGATCTNGGCYWPAPASYGRGLPRNLLKKISSSMKKAANPIGTRL